MSGRGFRARTDIGLVHEGRARRERIQLMLLENKTAIIYGAAGSIGSAVARAYAREGAELHLAGRSKAALDAVAEQIQHDGGAAHVAILDVLDRPAVEEHAAAVA